MKKKLVVTNKSAQEVKAILPQKPAKSGSVKSGGDLRLGVNQPKEADKK